MGDLPLAVEAYRHLNEQGRLLDKAIYMKLASGASFIQTPLPLLFVMTFLTGILCILLGLLAELLIRIYYESQGKTVYMLRSKKN